jgi:UDP-N-acetylglucosamine 1-carboxyvinyltransferase
MYLYEASVTGTETALLAAARAEGVTEIRHAATEPHVVELCQFLAKMGAGVTGIGSSTIRIEGRAAAPRRGALAGRRLHRSGQLGRGRRDHRREMAIDGVQERDIEVVAAVLERMNVQCGMRDGVFTVKPSKLKRRGASPPGCGRRFRATS